MVAYDIWEVSGGASSGGIVVRMGKERDSQEEELRLQNGALVNVLEHDTKALRLHYKMMHGNGPSTGWVSTRVQGRDLLIPWKGALAEIACQVTESGGGKHTFANDASSLCRSASLWEVPTVEPDEKAVAYRQMLVGNRAAVAVEELVLDVVEQKQAQARRLETGSVGLACRRQNSSFKEVASVGGLSVASYQQLQGIEELNCRAAVGENIDDAQDCICPQCHLPIGDFCYGDAARHAECEAQIILQGAKQEEIERRRMDARQKKARRAEYGIGWKPDSIPSNVVPVSKMGYRPIPQGMYCLVFDESSKAVDLAPSVDPASSVNLEYLSCALRIRQHEGREPFFSLDPKDPSSASSENSQALWQCKRFEPSWLAGTSVGEVMFQADFYLKELSMGEHAQPVTGMRSCFDFNEDSGFDHSKDWNAREWFVVSKANIALSQDRAILPSVEMGVEAREQLLGPDGLQDARITSSEHPLVKYADTFTHYFDVIAERKSVIFHLRELAKASALAKFLLESDAILGEQWFDLAGSGTAMCCLEIPQFWNERCYTQIQVQDGRILDAEKGIGKNMHGLYGGVEFGLDRQQVAVQGLATRAKPIVAKAHLTRGIGALEAKGLAFPYSLQAPPTAPSAALRGVDMSLDKFDLLAPMNVVPRTSVGKWADKSQPTDICVAIGSSFWSSLADGVFSEQDTTLFNLLFNPHLSDRRDECDMFVPPDPSAQYVERLSTLTEEEVAYQQRRVDYFYSVNFIIDRAGPLFPASWSASLCIAQGNTEEHQQQSYGIIDSNARIELALKSSTPIFDKQTEDGMKFRIYQIGSLNIRTTQLQTGKEIIGAVYVNRTSRQNVQSGMIKPQDRIIRITQYVEGAHDYLRSSPLEKNTQCHFYVVLDIEGGHCILVEKLSNNVDAWTENPSDSETRNALAKVTRFLDCSGAKVTLADIRRNDATEDQHVATRAASCANGRRFADDLFNVVQQQIRA